MISFSIIKKSKHSQARCGTIQTPHGIIQTPAFVPVATQAAVKSLTSDHLLQTNSQLIIANTFHLHLRPGENIIKNSGGLHKFMNWPHPIITDSGGFQVFSLGFGKDYGVGKIVKDKKIAEELVIKHGDQPQNVHIGDNGVTFRAFDGRKITLGPKESIHIQESLGADIIFAFDECTPPFPNKEYAAAALKRTNDWAKICIATHKTQQALFGIIQGSTYKELRLESAQHIRNLGFAGYGIGGDLGTSTSDSSNIIRWSLKSLEENKPRHLLGIGHLKDIPRIIKLGIDTFDCVTPTRYARHGIAFTGRGRINFKRSKLLKDKNPIDKNCACIACTQYRRNYIAHLYKAKEMSALTLITLHNLFYFNSFVEQIRKEIQKGKI